MNQPDRADAFRRMHQPDAGRILVLPQSRRAAAEVLEQGTFSSMQGGLTFPEANALFSGVGREA